VRSRSVLFSALLDGVLQQLKLLTPKHCNFYKWSDNTIITRYSFRDILKYYMFFKKCNVGLYYKKYKLRSEEKIKNNIAGARGIMQAHTTHL